MTIKNDLYDIDVMRTQYDLMSAMHYGESLQDYTGKTGEVARTLHAAIHQLSTALGIDSEGKDDEDLLKHSKEVFDALGKERQIEMLRELSEREVELQRKVREHLVAADLSDPDVFDYGDPAHYGKRPYGPFLQEAPPSRGTPGSRGIYGNYTPLKTYSGKEKQLIGKVLDLDMSLVKANKNGIALVVVATGKRRPGVPGEVMAVDVSTGEVLDSFSFTGGGAGPSSERHTNGITPGLSGELDFEEHADLQAQWGLNGLKYGGAGHWKDGDGVRWHVLTKDPMAKRAGMWIHPTKGNTYGCLGMQPGEAKRFRRFWEDQDGFPQMTFITQNVWERSLALDRSPGKKKKADLDPLASEEVQRAAADLRESVVAAVAVLEHQRGQTEMLKDMDQKRKNLRDGKSEAIEFGSVQYAANETVSAKDTLAPTIVETKPQDKDQQVVSSVV